jgi:cell division protein FtsW
MHRKSAYFLFLAVLGMLVIGIVMLLSTSAFARNSHGDVYFFMKRQLVWLGVGLVVCTVAALVDYHFWERTWWIWFVLAWWFARYEKGASRILQGFVYPFAIVVTLLLLIVMEVDLGTTALIGATMFVIMFVAGTHPVLLGLLSLSGVAGILFVATQMSERMGRLSAFMDPERFKDDAGLQQMQALIAWGSGGMEGLGLGNGRQKMAYLPYAHTDFIFPMIGEELGLRVSLLVVFLFVVIIVCGMMIALHAKDRVGLLLGCGIVSLLALQAAVNIGVTTSLLPNKGLPLPFVSYGGSNLAACLFGIGLLLNIYRQGVLEPANKKRTMIQARTTPRI